MPKRLTKHSNFLQLEEDIDLEHFAFTVKGVFQDIDDPRQSRKTHYPFWFLMLLVLCGYLSGANTIADLANYAKVGIC
ncbi:MAG: transposase family protein [Chlamydiota bacterium]